MSNNKKIEITKDKINELELKAKHEQDVASKIIILEEILDLRKDYTLLLVKKRPLLLTFALLFCIFWGISLMVCLPPFIVRGKKRDINEEKIKNLKQEIAILREKI